MASGSKTKTLILTPSSLSTTAKPTVRPRRVSQTKGRVHVVKVFENTDQFLISITEDRLALILNHAMQTNGARKNAIGLAEMYAGIFISLLLTLLTGTLHDFILSGDAWQGVLITCICVAFCLTAYYTWQAQRHGCRGLTTTIEINGYANYNSL